MLIDTHTHLYLPEFREDREEVIGRALDNRVNKLVLPNVDGKTIEGMLTLADHYPGICFPAIGLHPTSVKDHYLKELEQVEEWLSKKTFYAIGETGIDLYWDKSFLQQQIDSFRRQIRLAIKHELPLIIHCRESFEEIINIVEEMNDDRLRGIFHCFTGTARQAERVIKAGFHLGIGGVVTFKNSGLDMVVRETDIRHIVLETDAPYLAPVPWRGRRNESGYLVHIAEKLASIYDVAPDEIAEQTSSNARMLFDF